MPGWEGAGEVSCWATRCTQHVAPAVNYPLTFTVAPGNRNEKLFIKPLLEKLKKEGLNFNAVLADAQYDSSKVRETVKKYGSEPVIPYRRTIKIRRALKMGRDFVVQGIKRLVNLFKRRVCIERVFSRAKEWLLLDHLKVRGGIRTAHTFF